MARYLTASILFTPRGARNCSQSTHPSLALILVEAFLVVAFLVEAYQEVAYLAPLDPLACLEEAFLVVAYLEVHLFLGEALLK